MAKTRQAYYKQRKLEGNSLIDTNAKLLNNISPNHIQQHAEKILQPDQMGFTREYKVGRVFGAANVIHANRLKKKNHQQTVSNLRWFHLTIFQPV